MAELTSGGVVSTSLGPVAYSCSGSGPGVVLLHANPGDSGDWDGVVDGLAAGRRVVRLDWPGYGGSSAPAPASEASAPAYAAALAEALAGLERQAGLSLPVVLVGNSVGGYAALRQALEHPETVAGLVLVAPGGFTAHTALTRVFCRVMGSPQVARWLVGPLASLYTLRRTPASRAALRRAYAVSKRPDRLAVHSAVWRSFLDPAHDLRSQVGRLRVPVLLTWGRFDPVLPWLSDGRRAARLLPQARAARFWSGHEPHAETSAAWLAAVLPFLEQVAPVGLTQAGHGAVG